jgi:two-component system, OmpR family, response regulator
MNGPRIFIADDDAAMREWLRLLLRPMRADIQEASGGIELLELLASGDPFDLVITDLRMPGPTGLQVVAMARAAGVTTPFLIITAFPDDDVCRALAAAGAELLAKPFSAAELKARVAALIAGDADPGPA